MDNVANRRQIMRCALSTAGPPLQRIAACVQGVRTSVLRYNICTTGQKELETYGKNGHGNDDDDDAVGDEDDGNRGSDCTGKGVAIDVIGGQPTNLGVAILA